MDFTVSNRQGNNSRCVRAPPQKGSPKRDWLRSEGRSARRERRTEGKLPVPRQFGRRGRGQFTANPGGPMNLKQHESGVEQRHADGRDDKQMALLRKIGSGGQRTARLVAIARAGSGLRMSLRAALLFAEQPRRINQAARNRWQPNERQHQRDRCLDTLHG